MEAFLEAWQTQRRWLALRWVCAVVWAIELFWLQKLAFEAPPWVRFPTIVQAFRFYLDLISASIPVLLLQRRFLNPLLVLNLVLTIIIGTYVSSYHWPLMPVRSFFQWREAWSLHGRFFKIIRWEVVTLALIFYAVKFGLLVRSGNFYLRSQVRWRGVVLALMAYVGPVLLLQSTQLRLKVGPNGGYGRTVYAYGYSIPWVCDLISNAQVQTHRTRALEYLGKSYDRISPLEHPLPMSRRWAVLQLESICLNATEAQCNGAPVMPFLGALRSRSMFFRIHSFHRNGSCDMDYAALTAIEPYPGMVPYRLPEMPYTNSTPRFMKQHGYHTCFFHGNTALFYDRGPVLDRLGFDEVVFKEQLVHEKLPLSCIGVRDRPVFERMLAALNGNRQVFVFGITLDTHTPFEQLSPAENQLFARPAGVLERYLNSLRHLDGCLKDFVARIPEDTTLVLYGDHSASIRERGFSSDVIDGQEYVPVWIYSKEKGLAEFQRTRELPLATDGTLNLLDVISYLRHSIEGAQFSKHDP